MIFLARIIAIFFAIPVHEFGHAIMSYKLGDPTAKLDGRISLNPIKHIDPFGVLLIVLTGFGWAKPVYVNSLYYKDKEKGTALTALAGPLMNIIFAFLVFILYKIVGSSGYYNSNLLFILSVIISTNISLAVFNMLPIPPLDGFKVFSIFMSSKIKYTLLSYQQYSIIFFVIIIYTGILSYPLNIVQNVIINLMNTLTSFIG